MFNYQKTKYLLLMLFLILSLSACTSLRTIDNQIGRFLNKEAFSDVPETDSSEVVETDSSALSKDTREKIDAWLELNGYNRFGDAPDTYYQGGNPLLDEASGAIKERFEYILERHPDVLTKI